jgi:autotransporter-associated beta strand protein
MALLGDVVAGTDLLFSAPVVGVALVKNGAGTMELTQANSYAGPTTINAGTILANNIAGSATGAGAVVVKTGGTLGGTGTASGAVTVETGGTLAPGASIESLATGALVLQSGSVFLAEINSSGVPSADQAIVTGNVTLAGDLNGVDIAGSPVAITVGTKLTLISYTGTLTGEFVGKPEGSTFSIGINSFKIRYNDTKKVTLEAMGGSASDYDTWAAIYAPLGAATADDDADGLTNSEEYAFGLHPKSGSSVSPITVQPNKTTGTFTYTRRKPSLTGLTYKVWTSANLSAWTEDTTAIQTPTDVGDNQSVQVTLSGTKPLAAAKLFVRVTAE